MRVESVSQLQRAGKHDQYRLRSVEIKYYVSNRRLNDVSDGLQVATLEEGEGAHSCDIYPGQDVPDY